MQKQDIYDIVESKQDTYINASNTIWNSPEVRFELPQSANVLINLLENDGFTVERNVAEMEDAFVATYGSGSPVIGFLGEYDALTGLSQVENAIEKEARTDTENGHGCGHHGLGTGSALAAATIKEMIKTGKIKGTVKYFGCPAEESGSGKAFMARAGVFDGLDAILTWHPMTENRVWTTSSLANYQVYFKFKGISSHAAGSPHMGRSALDAAELMSMGVNYLREHIIDAARIHYAYIDAGGTSPNVVQSTSNVLYFIRAPKSSQVKEIYDRVVKIAQGAALMTETELEIQWDSACAEYIFNDTLGKAIYENMNLVGEITYTEEEFSYAQQYRDTVDKTTEINYKNSVKDLFTYLGEDKAEEIANQSISVPIYPYVTGGVMPGSTDVGDASWQAPTGQFTTASFPAATTAHSWQWVATGRSSVFHKGLIYAGKVLALTAYDLFTDKELLEKAQKEYQKTTATEKYSNPIPLTVHPKQ